MPRLFPLQQSKLTTVTITSSQNWTAPLTVNNVAALTGTGGTGSPGTSGYYDPPVDRSTYVTSVYGDNSSPSGVTPGQLDWSSAQGNGDSMANRINSGGSGNLSVLSYSQYANGYSISSSTTAYNNAIPGSASTYYSGGWKSFGPVSPGDLGFNYVKWQEYGAYHPGNPPTTGGTTTALGYSFPGGYGGAATPQTKNNVPVTPGQSYPISIPFGGSVTLQYYE